MEALTSRSRTESQLLQVHTRSCKVNSLLIVPQLEQYLELGANRPILRMFFPYHSALYSNISTNIDQLTSVIACAKLWFLTIPFTFKSSMQIVWFSLINFIEVLCKKSLRLFTTFSCSKASRCLVRLPLFFEYLRCTYFNLDCALRKFLGFSISKPFEATKKLLIPKSIPIVVFSLTGVLIGFSCLVSTNIDAKYLPVGVILIVALLIIPFIGLWATILTPSLNLGIISKSSLSITFCGTEKDCFPLCFDLYFGNPAPLKNFEYAASKLSKATCKDWLLTSFSHSHSFFKSTICFCKSYLERLTALPKYAVVLVSKARLYINLLLPICLEISSFWQLVGYNLNWKALNMQNLLQKLYQSLTEYNMKSKIINNNAIHHTHTKAMSVISC